VLEGHVTLPESTFQNPNGCYGMLWLITEPSYLTWIGQLLWRGSNNKFTRGSFHLPTVWNSTAWQQPVTEYISAATEDSFVWTIMNSTWHRCCVSLRLSVFRRRVLMSWLTYLLTYLRYLLMLLTNSKWHTGFRLYQKWWPWVTSNRVIVMQMNILMYVWISHSTIYDVAQESSPSL